MTALLSAAGLMSGGLLTASPAAAASATASAVQVKHLCAKPTAPGQMACLAEARTDVVRHMSLAPNAIPSGYGPADLQSAYNLPASTTAAGQTIAVVDAYDNPNAEADLATYRSRYGLPACTTANGCFTKLDENGGTSYPAADSGWAGEISLDLDMISAICPQCHIMLLEASAPSMTDLGTAINTAVARGAKYVSNSWGGAEDSTDTTADSQYLNHPGVALTFSAGDSSYGAQFPASSQYVTSVGGTALSRASNSRGWSESVWYASSTEGTGSGCSAYDPKPSWQTDTGCANKTVSDVSAVADPATGVAVYDSYSGGWNVYGGTSASSPIIAATYALAGTPAASSFPAAYPYSRASALNDVTSGSNGSCSPAYLCTAATGYDGPTGLGTPNGTTAFTSGAAAATLQAGRRLNGGQSISSTSMSLTMQSDGNLVAYLKTGPSGTGPAMWASGTYGHSGAYAVMQSDGNFVVYSSGGTALWSTGTSGHSGAYATLQNDGNFVLYSSGGTALWSDARWVRSQTIGSGQKLTAGWWTQGKYTRLVMQPDGNLVVYRNSDGKGIWSSGTYGHAGAYAYMQSDGNLVVYKSGGGPSTGGAGWSTGTYGHSGAHAIMQNDGNFVVYSSGGTALWSSGTYKLVP